MFDVVTYPIVFLLAAVLLLTFFFGTVPLIIAVSLGDKTRLERLLDLYTEVFAAGASAIIGALKIFRRKDPPDPPPPDDEPKLPPPNSS